MNSRMSLMALPFVACTLTSEGMDERSNVPEADVPEFFSATIRADDAYQGQEPAGDTPASPQYGWLIPILLTGIRAELESAVKRVRGWGKPPQPPHPSQTKLKPLPTLKANDE